MRKYSKLSPAIQFHRMREFTDLGSLTGIRTRLNQIASHPTILPGEAQLLLEASDHIKFILNNWEVNTKIARVKFMESN